MKYNVEKNAKFLNSMAPKTYDSVLFWCGALVGFIGLSFDLDYLKYLGFWVVWLKGSLMLFWMIYSFIHCIIAKKHGVPHGLKED